MYHQILHEVLSNGICNQDVLVSILGRRSRKQRQEIIAKDKLLYSDDYPGDQRIETLIRENFHGSFGNILLMLCDSKEYVAKCIHSMFLRRYFKYKMYIMHIFRSYTTEDMIDIKEAYEQKYEKSIESNISQMSGLAAFYREQLTPVLNADRPSLNEVNWDLAMQDAVSVANYNSNNQVEIFAAINSRTCCQERAAVLLYLKLKLNHIGMTTNDDELVEFLANSLTDLQNLDFMLIHAIVCHSEVDMVQIKEYFLENNRKSLREAILESAQGSFRDMLLILCGEEPSL